MYTILLSALAFVILISTPIEASRPEPNIDILIRDIEELEAIEERTQQLEDHIGTINSQMAELDKMKGQADDELFQATKNAMMNELGEATDELDRLSEQLVQINERQMRFQQDTRLLDERTCPVTREGADLLKQKADIAQLMLEKSEETQELIEKAEVIYAASKQFKNLGKQEKGLFQSIINRARGCLSNKKGTN